MRWSVTECALTTRRKSVYGTKHAAVSRSSRAAWVSTRWSIKSRRSILSTGFRRGSSEWQGRNGSSSSDNDGIHARITARSLSQSLPIAAASARRISSASGSYRGGPSCERKQVRPGYGTIMPQSKRSRTRRSKAIHQSNGGLWLSSPRNGKSSTYSSHISAHYRTPLSLSSSVSPACGLIQVCYSSAELTKNFTHNMCKSSIN